MANSAKSLSLLAIFLIKQLAIGPDKVEWIYIKGKFAILENMIKSDSYTKGNMTWTTSCYLYKINHWVCE